MTDPWAKVRVSTALKAIELSRNHDGSSVVTITAAEFMGLKDDARIIETDADALLASNKLLREALHEIAHGKHSGRGYANKILSETALPEHLR